MRKTQSYLTFFFMAVVAITACTSREKTNVPVTVEGAPGIVFDTLEHNFDTLAFKGDGSYAFRFVNVGEQPLIINNVQTTCGCTVPKHSKKPYASQEEGFIEVVYDTQRIGRFSKSIKVYTNVQEQPYVLTIKGVVQDTQVSY